MGLLKPILERDRITRLTGVTAVLAAASCIVSCDATAIRQTGTQSAKQSAAVALDRLADDVWRWRLERQPSIRLQQGLPIDSPVRVTLQQANADAEEAAGLLERLSTVDAQVLDRGRATTHAYLASLLQPIVEAPAFYKYEFAITPYAMHSGGNVFRRYAAVAPLSSAEGRAAYLTFLSGYARYIDDLCKKTAMQLHEGIVLPKSALAGVRVFWTNLRDRQGEFLPHDDRLSGLEGVAASDYLAAVEQSIDEQIDTAYESVLSLLDASYEDAAPDTVGLGQYEGGRAYYEWLIEQYTGYPISPETLHNIGVARMARIREAMAGVREAVGFDGDQLAFHQLLRDEPRFLAEDANEVEARYLAYLHEIEPLIPVYFSLLPKAPYGVKRADPATEAGLTFGYFQSPKPPEEPRGLYRYNGSKLSERSLFWSKPLIFHELVPGHHFQYALQRENTDLPAIRQWGDGVTMTAYREGWGEYAAHLGYEMGLYDDPYDRYGRLTMEAFTVARIVVDTGMNALGWSLQDARTYMRDTTFSSETEIASETLRYSTDIPGQALSYAYGMIKLLEFRARAEDALGEDFDIRDFHAAVLSPGALPLDVLDRHLLAWQQERR